MTDEQYQRLKRYIGLFYDWYMRGPHSRPSSHPLVVLEDLIRKSPVKARSGLLMAVNDTVEMTSDWRPEEVAEADRRFIESGAPSLSEIRRTYSKQYRRILKRGCIKSLEEYYMVKGIVDGGGAEVDASERDDLVAMLGSFESEIIPGCEI